ncbi:MAG: hypothetical protein RLY78_2752 [Pseudomonadota bacterium]|jgi:copper(I)-binding protein|uniref:Copper chaperone PCu(A)C n=1 Tax=Pseudaquabacterium rugosum TaxID=2984194 RepID=A0ABU9B7M4_9BURK
MALRPALPRRRLLCQAVSLLPLAPWLGAGSARACEVQTDRFLVQHPWCRETTPGQTEIDVFLSFTAISEDDALVGFETAVAGGCRLVRMGEPGPLPMPIPAGRDLHLSPFGSCLRLTALNRPLQLGRVFPLWLHFAHSGAVQTTLNVDYPAA